MGSKVSLTKKGFSGICQQIEDLIYEDEKTDVADFINPDKILPNNNQNEEQADDLESLDLEVSNHIPLQEIDEYSLKLEKREG